MVRTTQRDPGIPPARRQNSVARLVALVRTSVLNSKHLVVFVEHFQIEICDLLS